MKKQELIKRYENTCCTLISINGVLEDLRQLDEPKEKEKVTLPRPVANWISCVRGRNKTLHFALENAPEEVNLWFCEDEKNRQNVFADAWVNGYTVEKEKRYIVKVKGISVVNGCLKCDVDNSKWFFSGPEESDRYRAKHTIKELDKAGFGWVFDCTGIEIEEAAE